MIVVHAQSVETVAEGIPLGPLADYMSRDPSKRYHAARVRITTGLAPGFVRVALVASSLCEVYAAHGYYLTRDLPLSNKLAEEIEPFLKRVKAIPTPRLAP
jgi:hypothetical protein